MARKKGGEIDTREALVESAWALFQQQGYDAVPVDAIVRRAGLSKGTFFHYVPTKVHLLEAVCDRLAAPPWEDVADQVADRARSAQARLGVLLEGMRDWRLRHAGFLADLYRALARPENTVLLAKLAARQDAMLREALADILDQGRREGAFSIPDVEEMARLVCAVVRTAGDTTLLEVAAASPSDAEVVARAVRRGQAAAVAVERMLGMPSGALKRPTAARFGGRGRSGAARKPASRPPAASKSRE